MTTKKIMVYGIVLLSMLFWSLTYIWYKIVFTELQPITVMTFRLGISAMFMGLFTKAIGKWQHPNKKDTLWFIALSFFQPFLYFLFESHGVNLVSSTISAIIISTIPLFTPIVAYLFLKQKISILNLIGILISFFGVLMVVLGKSLRFDGSVFGIILLSGAVISALGYAVIIVRLTGRYNSFFIISMQNIFGLLFFLPLFFIFEIDDFSKAAFTSEIVINLLYLALLGSSLAYVFFTYSIKQLGITTASLFTNVIPIFTAALAFYFLGEKLSVFKFIGICIVVIGLFLGQTKLNTARNKTKKKS